MPTQRKSATSPSAGAASTPGIAGKPAAGPNRWQDHPLVHSRYFHTVPINLLDEVEVMFDVAYRQQPEWQLERRLSKAAGRQPGTVGFWNASHPLKHPLLLLEPRQPQEDPVPDIDAIVEAARRGMNIIPRHRHQRPLPMHYMIAAAYCGWLLTRDEFLREHDRVVDQLKMAIDTNSGLASTPDLLDTLPGHMSDPAIAPLAKDYQSLCTKWRLDRLVSPHLPLPAAPTSISLADPTPIHRQFTAGTMMHIPDIYGHLTAQQVADLQQQTASLPQPEHLRDWHQILSPGNRNRGKQIDRYARLFALLHVWRALRHRHGPAFHRKTGWLKSVIAEHFSIKPATVRRNLPVT